jgi:hypothetical protein
MTLADAGNGGWTSVITPAEFRQRSWWVTVSNQHVP